MRYLNNLLIATFILLASGSFQNAFSNEAAFEEGKTLFRARCAACHSVGKGKLVGPDLINVHERRQEDWIIQFVRSSQTLVKSGDAIANEVFSQFNKVVMPDNPDLSDDNVKSILAYIGGESIAKKADKGGGGGATVVKTGYTRAPELSILSFLEGNPVSPLLFHSLYWIAALTIVGSVVWLGYMIATVSGKKQ